MALQTRRYVPPALRRAIAQMPASTTDLNVIRSLLRQLHDMIDSRDRKLLLSRLRSLITPDGRTLFEYHAISLLQATLEQREEWKWFVPQLRTMWQHILVSNWQQDVWTSWTDQLLIGLDRNEFNALVHFVLPDTNNHKPGRSTTMPLSGRLKKASSTSPMLRRPSWLRSSPPSISRRSPKRLYYLQADSRKRWFVGLAIPSILRGIRARIEKMPDMILQGRNDGVRINFDLDASDITGIKTRLSILCGLKGVRPRGLISAGRYDKEDPRDGCEWLLRTLVRWNTNAFTDVPGALMLDTDLIPKIEAESHTFHHNSCLRWLGLKLMRFDVLTSDNSEKIVQYLMDELRKHALKVATSGRKLAPRAQEIIDTLQGKDDARGSNWKYSLLGSDNPRHGFASMLRGCFDRPDLQSE
ncbi:hypothetical protein DOTSEDRAFT_36267 [Dothistroma septosporum NZE10]|uniref:Uncharacterized protein n=1 Tax=Dothistroma septosporum (strain NZE10 / CBS 128990) TaxID=675120 RepID=N1PJU1_DOTSN|nr:hypothetical protein DOTSEDRAFT_36267 [Dothistroma septosporum NZE10]